MKVKGEGERARRTAQGGVALKGAGLERQRDTFRFGVLKCNSNVNEHERSSRSTVEMVT